MTLYLRHGERNTPIPILKGEILAVGYAPYISRLFVRPDGHPHIEHRDNVFDHVKIGSPSLRYVMQKISDVPFLLGLLVYGGQDGRRTAYPDHRIPEQQIDRI